MKQLLIALAIMAMACLGGCGLLESDGYVGGGYYIDIDQSVTVRHVLDDTYYVSTDVWVRNLMGLSMSLEDMQQDIVGVDGIERAKERQMEYAKSLIPHIKKQFPKWRKYR